MKVDLYSIKASKIINTTFVLSSITLLVIGIIGCASIQEIGIAGGCGMIATTFILTSLQGYYNKKFNDVKKKRTKEVSLSSSHLNSKQAASLSASRFYPEQFPPCLLKIKFSKYLSLQDLSNLYRTCGRWKALCQEMMISQAITYGMPEGKSPKTYFWDLKKDTVKLWRAGQIPQRFLVFNAKLTLRDIQSSAMHTPSYLACVDVWQRLLNTDSSKPTGETRSPITAKEIERMYTDNSHHPEGSFSTFSCLLLKLHEKHLIVEEPLLEFATTHAAAKNDLSGVKLLTALGSNPNYSPTPNPTIDPHTSTCLTWAIKYNNEELAFWLITFGKVNPSGYATPLHSTSYTYLTYACTLSFTNMVKLLLSLGANPNGVDKLGKTPLNHCYSGSQIHKLLLETQA